MTTVLADDETRIRTLIDGWGKAIGAKDIDAVMSHYAADIVTFDLAPPLQTTGADALKKSLEAWFPTFRGPVGYEIRDLCITTGGVITLTALFSQGDNSPRRAMTSPSAAA